MPSVVLPVKQLMEEGRDRKRGDKGSRSTSVSSLPLILDIDDFKLTVSFQVHYVISWPLKFGNLIGANVLPNGHVRTPSDVTKVQALSSPLFPEVDAILTLFRDSCKELIDLQKQIDGRLYNLKKEVSAQDSKHHKTLAELEKGVDGLFDSFARLDSRISGVGQTAAKRGDHLQYMMEFNSSPGDLMELSPLFLDDTRVAEAASIAQKLRSFAEEDIGRHSIPAKSDVGNTTASRGLEVAVANLQDYCNGPVLNAKGQGFFQFFYGRP